MNPEWTVFQTTNHPIPDPNISPPQISQSPQTTKPTSWLARSWVGQVSSAIYAKLTLDNFAQAGIAGSMALGIYTAYNTSDEDPHAALAGISLASSGTALSCLGWGIGSALKGHKGKAVKCFAAATAFGALATQVSITKAKINSLTTELKSQKSDDRLEQCKTRVVQKENPINKIQSDLSTAKSKINKLAADLKLQKAKADKLENDKGQTESAPTPPPLHQHELEVEKLFGKEALQLDPQDPRPKLLFLVGQEDHNGAHHVESVLYNKRRGTLGSEVNLKKLDISHDIRYKVINDAKQICNEIAKASQTGDLKTVIIQAHGNANGITFSKDSKNNLYVNKHGKLIGIDGDCFSGLHKDATITLDSCKTGSTANGIASAISKMSKRGVWAPQSTIGTARVAFSKNVPAVPTFFNFDVFAKWTRSPDLDVSSFADAEDTHKFFPDGTYQWEPSQTKGLDWPSKLEKTFFWRLVDFRTLTGNENFEIGGIEYR